MVSLRVRWRQLMDLAQSFLNQHRPTLFPFRVCEPVPQPPRQFGVEWHLLQVLWGRFPSGPLSLSAVHYWLGVSTCSLRNRPTHHRPCSSGPHRTARPAPLLCRCIPRMSECLQSRKPAPHRSSVSDRCGCHQFVHL